MFKNKMISVDIKTEIFLNKELSSDRGWNTPYPENIIIHSLLITEGSEPQVIGAVIQTHNFFVIGQRDWLDINMYYRLK
jgi:hypothetical protein